MIKVASSAARLRPFLFKLLLLGSYKTNKKQDFEGTRLRKPTNSIYTAAFSWIKDEKKTHSPAGVRTVYKIE